MRSDQGAAEEIVQGETPSRFSWKLLLATATSLTVLVFAVFMAVQGELIPPVVVFMLLALIGLLLLRVKQRAGVIMLAVISVLFFALNLPFIAPTLSVPESTVDFLASALSVLGLLAMVVASIALLRRRGGDAMRFTGAIGALAVIAVAVAIVARLGYEGAEARPGDITVVLEDFEFSPAVVRSEGGQVAVFLENQDTVLHTFTVEELDVDVNIPGSGSARVTFQADPGRYEFICEPHQPDMDGTLEVEG